MRIFAHKLQGAHAKALRAGTRTTKLLKTLDVIDAQSFAKCVKRALSAIGKTAAKSKLVEKVCAE